MASIIKRKKNYSVVYNYVDENGETKQKWETWHTHKEALKRKAEIENQQHTGTFLPPSNQTITEFLYDFVSLYGEKKWGVSMYDSQTALIANYINPIIGDMEVQAVTPRAVDGYIQTLQKTKSVSTKTRKAVTTYVSDKTIEKIIKLLRCAFKQAVRWEIIARNPFDNVILPKTEYAKRDIWTADMIRLALDKCTDSKLYVAMNLSFACSLRMRTSFSMIPARVAGVPRPFRSTSSGISSAPAVSIAESSVSSVKCFGGEVFPSLISEPSTFRSSPTDTAGSACLFSSFFVEEPF